MSNKEIIHFENLWEKAEELAKSLSLHRQTVLNEIQEAIKEYIKLDNVPSKEIQKTLKTKKIGEILFRIAEISRTDDINTYAAMQLEVDLLDNKNNN